MEDYDDYFDNVEDEEDKNDGDDEPCEYIDLASRGELTAEDKYTKCEQFQAYCNTVKATIQEYQRNSKRRKALRTKQPVLAISHDHVTSVMYEWVRKSHEYMYTWPDNGFSASDLLFVLMCQLVLYSDPPRWLMPSLQSRIELLRTQFFPVLYHLRVLVCRHTQETIIQWPTSDELVNICGRVAQLTVYTRSAPIDKVRAVLLAGEGVTTATLKLGLTEEIKTQVALLQQARPETDDEKKKRLIEESQENKGSPEEIELFRQKKIARAAYNKSVQETGVLWNDDLNTAIKMFIPISERVMKKIQLDNMILNKVHQVLTIEQQREKWPKWLDVLQWKQYRSNFLSNMQHKAKSFSSSEAFRKRFENLCYEMVLPLGSRFEHLRDIDTQHVNELPIQLVEEQLGKRTQTYLYWLITNKKCTEMINDPSHFMHGAAVMNMLWYLLRQRAKLYFYRDYFIQASQVYSREESHLFLKERADTRCLPSIVNLKGRWYLRYIEDHMDEKEMKVVLLECPPEHNDGFVHAAAMWCCLVLFEHKGETENYRDIKPFLKEVLLTKPKVVVS